MVFGPTIINLVKACLSPNISRVLLPNEDFSEGFPIESGVREGDCISPSSLCSCDRTCHTFHSKLQWNRFFIARTVSLNIQMTFLSQPRSLPLEMISLWLEEEITLNFLLKSLKLNCMAFRCKIELEQMHNFFFLLFKLLFSRWTYLWH